MGVRAFHPGFPVISKTSYGVAVHRPVRPLIELAAGRLLQRGNLSTIDQVRGYSVAQQRFVMFLLVLFAAMALVLALTGIYGTISYTARRATFRSLYRERTAVPGLDFRHCAVGALPIQL